MEILTTIVAILLIAVAWGAIMLVVCLKATEPKEVADRLGMNRQQVTQLASNYRRKGIFMKKMPKGPVKTNLEELILFSKQFAEKKKTRNQQSEASLNN